MSEQSDNAGIAVNWIMEHLDETSPSERMALAALFAQGAAQIALPLFDAIRESDGVNMLNEDYGGDAMVGLQWLGWFVKGMDRLAGLHGALEQRELLIAYASKQIDEHNEQFPDIRGPL